MKPKILLHLEGLAVAVAAVIYYIDQDYGLLAFIALLMVPDVGILGYLVNSSLGGQTYNLTHTYIVPLILLLAGLLNDWDLGVQLGLIWLVHMGADRALGFGLKYPTEFKDTHMNRV
jgi:hypothetical protein